MTPKTFPNAQCHSHITKITFPRYFNPSFPPFPDAASAQPSGAAAFAPCHAAAGCATSDRSSRAARRTPISPASPAAPQTPPASTATATATATSTANAKTPAAPLRMVAANPFDVHSLPSGAEPSPLPRREEQAERSRRRKLRQQRQGGGMRILSKQNQDPIDLDLGLAALPTETLTSSETHRSKFLTREEEGEISGAIQALRVVMAVRASLQEELNDPDGATMHILPDEARWAEECGMSRPELRATLQEGADARTRLVAANTGLVTNIAKRHFSSLRQSMLTGGGGSIGTILTQQDLVQEGNLGLMEAAERFDPSKGFRFSTYATYWVRQRISRCIADSSRVIRLPAHVHDKLGTIRKTERNMAKEMGRTPTMAELADRVGIPLSKLELYSISSRNVLSLEVPLNAKADDSRTLGDRIASRSPSPADDAEFASLRTEIRQVMKGLTERERDVLEARFGLDGARPPLSVVETARELGISRDRCRTIMGRALNKLRHSNRNYRLKDYVGGAGHEEEAAARDDMRQLQLQQRQRARHECTTPVETPESMWSY